MDDGCLIKKPKPVTAATVKEAEGSTIFLIEELSDARLHLAELKNYIKDAMELIEKSGKKDEWIEIAAHLIHGIPDTVFKLEKSLNATAMAAARIDYEEIKQSLNPEKADQLESVLPDVRMRHAAQGAQSMNPKDVVTQLSKIAQEVKTNPNKTVLAANLRSLLACVAPEVTAEVVAPVAVEESTARFEEGKPADPTSEMSEEDAAEWKKQHFLNKDKFKAASASNRDRWKK